MRSNGPLPQVAPFGKEKDISIPDWPEAKANYKTFLSGAFDDAAPVDGSDIMHSWSALVTLTNNFEQSLYLTPVNASATSSDNTRDPVERLELGMKNLASPSSNVSSDHTHVLYTSVLRAKQAKLTKY